MSTSPSTPPRDRKCATSGTKKKKSWKKIVARSSTPRLHQRILSGNLDAVAKRLSKHASELNLTDDSGRTPLHVAAVMGHVEIVNFLIAKCAIIEAVDNNGLTPFHCACSCTNEKALLEVCSVLLSVGQVDVNKRTHAGTTPLHYFVRNECTDTVMFLEILSKMIARGADINAQNKNGETPLHQAAERAIEQNVMLLLSCAPQINLDHRDKNGETALHYACRAGSLAAARLLLDFGADISISGVNGTPIEVAERAGHVTLLHTIDSILEAKRSHAAKKTPTTTPNTPSKKLQSLTFDPTVLETAETMGYDSSMVIACLYQLQKRGAPTDNLQILIQEINRYTHNLTHQRECSVCLSKEVDSLLLPCRHSATCIDCGERVKEQTGACPICRTSIDDVLKIFLS